MITDSDNPVIQLCAAGMAIEGDAPAARELFAKAWEMRRDDYDAAIAAHFVARHQTTPELTLHWNALAVRHAMAVGDDRATPFLASLYLNLGEAQRVLGHDQEATTAAELGRAALIHLPSGGYRDFVAAGIDRLRARFTPSDVGERT
jgi:hypothetical protein